MKTRLVFIGALFLMCSTLFAADKYEDFRFKMLWDNLIKYEITSMKVTQIQYEYGVPLNYGYIYKEYKFDKNMNVIESKYYKKDKYKGKFLYEYNSNMDTTKITNLDDDGDEIYRCELNYDSKGYLIEKNHYKKTKFDYKEEFINDNQGQLIEYKKYKKDKLDLSFKYKYNSNAEEIEFERFDEDNIRDMQGISNYNEKGLKTDSIYYFEELEDLKVDFTYDKNDWLIERKFVSSKVGLLERYTYKYNMRGQLLEEKKYDDHDVMVKMYTIEYMDDGQIEKIEIYEEKEFLVGIWRFNYHLNGLLKDEHYYNKLDIPQFLRQYDYVPVQQ
jgi:hypothetical protein